ncbi:hypothetical protein N7451_012012 [Penicillium sp. IBT 35674x]|nr:hypothetical protein N7451_012012 [Penicillium sp. IBT 35674x]
MFFFPETYAAKLLRDKTRRQGGVGSGVFLQGQLRTCFTRPWLMLFAELILFLLYLYMAFVYGILYVDFTAYPIIYEQSRRWSFGFPGLSFLGIGLGMAIATIASPYVNMIHGKYVSKLGPVPEARLPHLVILSWLIPVSLFWFGWTALPPIIGIISGAPFGFLGITSYLTDCYGPYGASALAANAVFRSVFGAVFPLFGTNPYDGLGVPWGSSLLDFFALAFAPLLWVFYHFGPRIRMKSKYHRMMIGDGA